MCSKVERGWKNLSFTKYDGTTNLDEHINAYGVALNWCTHLPPNSVDSFKTLLEKFGAQYATSKAHQLTSIVLVNLRQEEDESLCSYMERFSIVAVKINDLNLEVALYSLIMALKPGLFSSSLCKRPLASMDKLRVRASCYIQMEETMAYQDGNDKLQKGSGSLELTNEQERQGRRRKEVQVPGLPSLTTNRATLLKEAFNAELIALLLKGGRNKGPTKSNIFGTTRIKTTQSKRAKC
ncbi:hypothetical protein CR513_00050, partial [Mucuna pruriens]